MNAGPIKNGRVDQRIERNEGRQLDVQGRSFSETCVVSLGITSVLFVRWKTSGLVFSGTAKDAWCHWSRAIIERVSSGTLQNSTRLLQKGGVKLHSSDHW